MKKKSKRRFIILGVLALLLVLGFVGFNNLRDTAKKNLVASATIYKVEKTDLIIYSFAKGKIVSADSTEYSFTGSLSSNLVGLGDMVVKGTDLGKYTNMLNQTKLIESKVSGIVTQVPSSFSNTWVISDADKLQMSVQISEKDIAKITLNQQAFVYIDALKVTVEGEVTDINYLGNTTADYTTYTVTVSFDKADQPIFLGMTGSGKIEISANRDILVVPVEALIESNGKTYLLDKAWLEDVSKPEKDFYIEVTVGVADINFAQVSADNLENKEVVILPADAQTGFFAGMRN
ncbi:MAG: hypothetical protein HGB31_01795 [Erysipelotrichaceae bacterium]|nr:hypothetical protein [Erysipelotrichaceae bacterium]